MFSFKGEDTHVLPGRTSTPALHDKGQFNCRIGLPLSVQWVMAYSNCTTPKGKKAQPDGTSCA